MFNPNSLKKISHTTWAWKYKLYAFICNSYNKFKVQVVRVKNLDLRDFSKSFNYISLCRSRIKSRILTQLINFF